MNAKRHALLARQLIAACGGLNEAASACRLERSRLSVIQDPKSDAFMPADVMADLEDYCGQPLYSRALCDARPATEEGACLATEAQETTEAAATVQKIVRLMLADGQVTAAERVVFEAAFMELELQVREFRTAADAVRA